MIGNLFKKYKKLGQDLLDAVDEVKQKNFAFTVAKRNTLIFIIAISLIITLLKPSGTKNFEGTIIGIGTIHTDLSKYNAITRELNQAKEAAEKAAKAESQKASKKVLWHSLVQNTDYLPSS